MSTITFYQTDLTPERNAWVEDLHDYLGTYGVERLYIPSLQYQKIAMNFAVKVPADQSKVGDQGLGNYAELVQDNRSYFFFITNVAWTSQAVVTVSLSMDTINTFGEELRFTPLTTIERQHMNRFRSTDRPAVGRKDLIRNIQRETENLVLPQDLYNTTTIRQEGLDCNWFLVYKTRDDLTPTNYGNPIQCSLVAEYPALIKAGTSFQPAKELTGANFTAGKFYYMDPVNNPGAKMNPGGNPSTTINNKTIWQFSQSSGAPAAISLVILTYKVVPSDNGASYTLINKSEAATYAKVVFTQSQLFKVSNYELGNYNDIVNLQVNLPIPTGAQSAIYTIPFSSIDKTDSKLMKIIRLPYPPITITINNKGEYVFPHEWYYDNGMMRLKTFNLASEFENNLGKADLTNIYRFNTEIKPTGYPLLERESKLYHSDFYTYKFVYDNFFKEIKLENLKFYTSSSDINVNIPISFKPTNTVNSKFAFKFDLTHMATKPHEYIRMSDYEDYMIVGRNNEETIFSNDYINYIRNGYNYDQKQKTMSAVSGALGIVSGGVQAGVSAWASRQSGIANAKMSVIDRYYNAPEDEQTAENLLKWTSIASAKSRFSRQFSPFLSAAAISAGFNAVNGITNTIIGQIQQQEAINQKLQMLGAQATNVSGSDDVDLLQYYNGNRLEIKEYHANELARNNLFRLFYYTGYNYPKQALPDLNGRYWFNYIKCQPVFRSEGTNIYHNYLDDIKIRFAQGVTKFHHHPEIFDGWDLDQTYENWETNILDTSNFPTEQLPLGSTAFKRTSESSAITATVTWTNTRRLDHVVERLEFNYFDIEGQEVNRKTSSQGQTSIILENIDPSVKLRVRRIDVWNSKLNSEWKII